jgi:subtilisin family serine protease
MKPDVSAPGSSIRSSVPGTSYSIMSGTSMAAPHVAGLAALLISARPELAGQVDYLELLISRSAVPRTTTQICGGIPGSEVPNNTYGWGRVDAWLAFQKHLLLIDKTAPISLVEPGRPFDYRIDLTHLAVLTPTTNLVITDTLPLNTSFVTATLPHTLAGSLVEWNFASLAPLGSESVTLTVQAPSEHIVLTNSLYGARSAEAPAVLGLPVEVFVGYFYRFAFIPYSLAVP